MPIDSHLTYLQKHAFCPPQVTRPPQPGLRMVVVVACRDEPELLDCLLALRECNLPGHAVEVLVVIGDSEEDAADLKARNLALLASARAWAAEADTDALRFHCLHFPNLPARHAGMGLLRKVGMDEAVHRLNLTHNPRGIIASLDAEAVCDAHYLTAIAHYFDQHPTRDSCSLAFAFPTSHDASPQLAAGALRVELAHRLLIAGLRHGGHPYAYSTLGTAMAVRSGAYQAQGGMNRRKVDEDFHFLQKFIELGVHGNCTATCVQLPMFFADTTWSSIGQKVMQYWETPDPDYPVFALESFVALQQALAGVRLWQALDAGTLDTCLAQFPDGIREFMQHHRFTATVQEIQRYTRSPAAFEKRFYRWLDGRKTFHYLQHCRDHHWANRPLLEVGNAMRGWMEGKASTPLNLKELLLWYRERAGQSQEVLPSS